MLTRAAVVAVLVACNGAAGPCGDAADASLARAHAKRQTEAREHPERAADLEAEQLADDLTSKSRRSLVVQHCVDDAWIAEQRACVAGGDDFHTCLDYHELIAIESDRVRVPAGDYVDAYSAVTERMCACRDRGCAQRLVTVLAKLGDLANRGMLDPDAGAAEKVAVVARRLSDCMSSAFAQQ